MNCAFHSHNGATVSCNGCGKPLCPACDHRIKGFPYCQDCIVRGVDLLRSQYRGSGASVVSAQTSPFAAFILSFICPGLGAAYNGQTHKALVHFGVSVGLFQLAILTGVPFFVFGVIGMWLYSMVDAWKTARLIRSGATPDLAEDVIVQRFAGNPKLWGFLLVLLGSTFLLQMFFDIRHLMRTLLPVFLIALGLYILRSYFLRNDVPAAKENTANAFIGASADVGYTPGKYDAGDDYPTKVSAKSWRNR